jgi:putative copper export protein
MLSHTVWGWGWLAQLFGVLVAVAGFALARRQRRTGWALATAGAAVLAFTPALSGHAAAAPRLAALAVLADGLHIIGAGGWLGSLLFVVAVGVPMAMRLDQGERGPAVADLVSAYSPTALFFAGVAAATGVVAAWVHFDSVSALWTTPYGRTLLVKLGILSVVAGTGAHNWRRVRPALGDTVGTRRIRRSAAVELAVGALVLVVTAILVATPTPMDSVALTAR